MKKLGSILLKGLVTILPIGLTVYFVYWLGVTTETLLSKPIKWVMDDANYWPGMGLITGFVLLFLIGLAVNAFIVRRVLGIGEELLLRVPVVKTVYSAIRDMTRLVNTDKKKGDLDRVVTLDIGFGKMIGFVTQEHANTLGIGGGEDLVAVYLPMSYQIGGYTIYLPRSRVSRNGTVGRAGDAHRAHGRRARQVEINGDTPRFASKRGRTSHRLRVADWAGEEVCPFSALRGNGE